MKTPSTFLYDLVHSLSKSEKRYIKVQAGSGDKDYLRLMDALLIQRVYDEEKLVRKYEGANFIKHLSVNKRYLYDLILKSLVRFGQKSLEDKVFEKMSAANILMEKNMFQAAFNELRKGRKVAERYELFELQFMLDGIEKNLLSQRNFKNKDKDTLHHIYNAEMYNLEQLKNTTEYWYLFQQLVQFQMQFQKIQTEEQKRYIKTIVEAPKFKEESLATNFKSKVYYFQANATYQFMIGNVQEAYKINGRFLELMENHPHFLNIYAERYLATINNMLIDSLMIGKYDVLEEGINRLSTTTKRPEFRTIKNIEARVFRQRYLLLINWSLSQKDFRKALDWIPEIEEGLNTFGKKIEKHHRITFYYLCAYLLFLNGKYEQALEWNYRIIDEPKQDVVKEIFYFARVLNLLLHYELGNHTLLESLLLSTPKYLRSKREIYETEKALFRFLRKIIHSINRKEEEKLKADFKSEILELAQIPKEKRVFNYLDLRLWIEN